MTNSSQYFSAIICTILKFLCLSKVFLIIGAYNGWTKIQNKTHEKEQIETKKKISEKYRKSRLRKAHFEAFASVEVEDQPYMTPKDFIDCVIHGSPRPRINRNVRHVQKMQKIYSYD